MGRSENRAAAPEFAALVDRLRDQFGDCRVMAFDTQGNGTEDAVKAWAKRQLIDGEPGLGVIVPASITHRRRK